MSKEIYHSLFHWLIERSNHSLGGAPDGAPFIGASPNPNIKPNLNPNPNLKPNLEPNPNPEPSPKPGLLDIFGFENQPVNGQGQG